MKNLLIVVCILMLLSVFSACNTDSDNNPITFSGTIIEINGDSAIIEPFEGESIRGSADKISISLSDRDEVFAVGDKIIVYYDGVVMESYPAQVNVQRIERME